jgi:hypothetical protein
VPDETPVLLLGYNRPEQMQGLIRSLAALKPKLILLSVDGPRMNRLKDVELVRQTQEMVNEITWDAEIRTRFRESNLGLRNAVVDAVTWANNEFGKVIVLEDDVRAGPQLLDFLNYNLMKYENQRDIAHINGYNLVPNQYLSNPSGPSRMSIYPESYAWATWEKAWSKYDDNMSWAKNVSISELKNICGSTIGALRWKQNFSDAAAGRIDTWAYRWIASLWKNQLKIVSPNRNISNYKGWENGTHTFFKVKYQEPEIEYLNIYDLDSDVPIDKSAEKWLQKHVFSENFLGVSKGIMISELLKFRKIAESLKLNL